MADWVFHDDAWALACECGVTLPEALDALDETDGDVAKARVLLASAAARASREENEAWLARLAAAATDGTDYKWVTLTFDTALEEGAVTPSVPRKVKHDDVAATTEAGACTASLPSPPTARVVVVTALTESVE
jgi:hypothetical protein